ncbi:MAG: cation transporter, partial [Planctomycetota bacterium]
MKSNEQLESFALRLSIFGYLGMAILGIVFALLTGSGAIMVDGVYSLVSFVMAILAAGVARLVDRPGDETFHFGYAHFEPLLNLLRGLMILTIAAFALVSAVLALVSGGRPLSPGLALAYSVCVALMCLGLSAFQRRSAKKTESPTLTVDARNWLVDGVITMAVGVGFLIGVILKSSAWSHLLPYVDPAVVICL